MAMWVDCKTPKRGGRKLTPEEKAEAVHEADFLELIIKSRYVTRNGSITKHADKSADDLPVPKIEIEANGIERAAIDRILERG